MSGSETPDQAALRAAARKRRRSLSDDVREHASKVICEKVVRASWFQRARNVACFLPMDEEVRTLPLIERAWRMQKRLFVPIVRPGDPLEFRELRPESDLYRNSLGILEPSSGDIAVPSRLDVVITPLVAFDDACRRVGMGGGYYDRTFAFLACRRFYYRPKLVGVAFACQQVEKIEANAWDIPLFCVITDEQFIAAPATN